jgi:uncharacterized protein (DUF952 family)
MSASRVYRLIPRDEWRAARARGAGASLPWSDDDRRDGFLHLSAREQVAETARRHYTGVRELWVLELDAAVLGERLRWEASRGGALFPHCYDKAPLAAVTDARPFDPREFA